MKIRKSLTLQLLWGWQNWGMKKWQGLYLKERLSTKMSEKTLDDIKMKEELLDMELFLNKIL